LLRSFRQPPPPLPFPPQAGSGFRSLHEGGSKKGSLLEGAADEGGWRRFSDYIVKAIFKADTHVSSIIIMHVNTVKRGVLCLWNMTNN
jgi:hypothetical protein